MTENFNKNIKSLIKKDPVLASKLFAISENKKYELVQHGNDNANINLIDMQNKLPMYETTPLNEIIKHHEEFEKKYKRYPFLFQFGIGNGVFLKLLMENEIHKSVIVYEPDIEILWIALNLIDFSDEIKKSRILFYLTQDYTYADAYDIFNVLEVKLYSRTYFLYAENKYYEKVFFNEMKKVNDINIRAIKEGVTSLGNDTIDTLIGIEHHIQNLPAMIKGGKFSSLKNNPLSDYAIIVSTGPSLTKQLPLLKEIQDYVTIISVDASMPILEKWGIVPDFVTSIERVEATAKFFENTSKEFQEKFITIHASLQHEKVLTNSYGEKLLVMRPFRYTRFYNLDEYGYLGRGMSAANMAYELAYLMGYKNIVFIGQDLAYAEDGRSHAKDHVFGENEVKNRNDTFVIKYGGDGFIKTNYIWNMFRGQFEADIAQTKKEGVKTYNATEGGARIEGAIEKPFIEIVNKIKKTKKKKPFVNYPNKKEINKNLIKAYKKTLEMIEYGEEIQKKVEDLFLELVKTLEEMEEYKNKNELDKIDYQKLQEISDKIDDLKEKVIDSDKFAQIFAETVQSYLIQKEMILAVIAVQNPQTEEEKKEKLFNWVLNHKDWLFNLAGSINAQVIVAKRAIKNLEEEIKNRKLEDKIKKGK